jgi:predicted unusual protein kinase regulating ubiquinone biosynthesis (AarF/ABC1/UbiB family)
VRLYSEAAASLGQVYRATLLDGGQEVALKVQRPGIPKGLELDFHLIRTGRVVQVDPRLTPG